jgi:type IV pilus assembly protein PilE
MRIPAPNRRLAGFSLIELMVAVAIVAILAAIAYPSYQSYVQRTRRAAAAACLQEAAHQMERRFTTSMAYNNPNTLPATGCANDISGSYSLAFATGEPTAGTFTIVATPIGGQANDTQCAALALNHLGVRMAQGSDSSADLVARCWR